MSQTLLQLEKIQRAVEYCLLSYDNEFKGEINSDSTGSDFWIWEFRSVHKELYFCVRGSDDLEDWLRNASLLPAHIPRVGFAHGGFKNGAEIIAKLTYGIFTHASKVNYKIVLCGHSYGGAVVQIMQQLLLKNFGISADCITFGSPRVWCPFAKVLGYHTRVYADSDPITKLPFLGHLLGVYGHRETESFEIDSKSLLSIDDHSIKNYNEYFKQKVNEKYEQLHDEKFQNPRTRNAYNF